MIAELIVAKARGNDQTGWLEVETLGILGQQDLENYHREYDDDTKKGRDTTRREQGARVQGKQCWKTERWQKTLREERQKK